MTVRELSDELEVSEKTIRRDLTALRSAGIAIDEVAGAFNRKSYRVDPRWAKPDLGFTIDEALALYLGRRFLQPLLGTYIWEAAQRAYRKIRSRFGDHAVRHIDKLRSVFQESEFGLADYSRHGEIIDALQMGIEDRRVVFITYHSLDTTEPVTYDVHPYRFVRHQGSLYLLGYKPDEQKRKTWRVDRIQQADKEQVPFNMPSDKELDAWLRDSFGIYEGQENLHVTVHFAPEVARLVQEKHWHASQKFTPQKDGSLIAQFRLSSTVEVKGWILSFGKHAQVLEPESLREEIGKELRSLSAVYGLGDEGATRRESPS